MNKRTLLLVAFLISVPTVILFLISWLVQPLLPAPWNNALILFGAVIAAVLAALSGITDTVQLAKMLDEKEDTSSAIVGEQSNVRVNAVMGDVTIIGEAAATSLLARWGKTGQNLQGITEKYLRYLINRYRYLEFQGMGVTDRIPLKLVLLEMYIPLQARIEMPEGEAWSQETRDLYLAGRRMRDVSEEEAEAIGRRISQPQPVLKLLQENAGLIILGDPGAGKTTFLKFLTLCLAAQQDIGLGQRLPVLLPLSAYANALAQQRRLALPDFITAYYREMLGDGLPVGDLLDTALREGQALLLLDGLDEVKETGLRLQVVERVTQFFSFSQQQGNKFVLTSRIVGYKDVRPITDGLAECTLIDFSGEEIEQFISLWTTAIERAAQEDPQLAARKAQQERAELLHAVANNPGVRRLASNPLLLTILALMKRQGVNLPERRVQLYDQYVKTLLKHWNLARGLDSGQARDLDEVETMKALGPLALWMHETSPGVGLVKQHDMQQQLRRIFQERGMPDAEQAAKLLLRDARDHASLLVERGQGSYGFIHLTFQEYLAAVGVAAKGQQEMQPVVDILAERLDDDNWHEVTLLTIGYLGIVQGRDEAAGSVLALLVAQRPGTPGQAEIIAGEAVVDAWPGGVSHQCRAGVIAALLAAMRDDGRVQPVQRAKAGQVLARLGDPRPEVMDVDAMQFCCVPPGPFWMGSDEGRDGEKPQHWVEMPHAYWLSRFPVTNAQYALFMKEGGYTTERYWSEAREHGVWDKGKVMGFAENEPRNRPVQFGHPFDLPDHPVVGVMWYEALAYTRWLTERWREWLPDAPEKWGVRLPTEAEWEKGARGGVQIPAQAVIQPIAALRDHAETAVPLRENQRNQAAYIWGSAVDVNRANYKDSGIGSSSAVGCFPGGASPYGVEEMAGNVWEWLNSKHKGYAYQADDGREEVDASNIRVLRGGYFGSSQDHMRCAYRLRYSVHLVLRGSGFRVCVSPFLSSLWPLDPLDSVTLKGRR